MGTLILSKTTKPATAAEAVQDIYDRRALAAAGAPVNGIVKRIRHADNHRTIEQRLAALEALVFSARGVMACPDAGVLIPAMVAAAFNLPNVSVIFSKGRVQPLCFYRQVAHWLLKTEARWSHYRIAGLFDIDHTTITHSERSVRARMDSDFAIRQQLMTLAGQAAEALHTLNTK